MAHVTSPGPPARSFREKLDAGERHWIWKVGLRALLVIVAIIGIGCMAWATSMAMASRGLYDYDLDDGYGDVWSSITFGVSILWCTVSILVLLLRKRPVHPGAAVGLDLVLWLAYIPTTMLAIIGVMQILRWGEDGVIGQYSSDGFYLQAPNGTWLWNATEYDSYYSRVRGCSDQGHGRSRYSGVQFDSCEEQDAYINSMWNSKGHRTGVVMTGVVCQAVGLFLHIALFIWACVDTHYRNSRKVSKEAEQLAADIVMKMIQSGAVVRPPPAAHHNVNQTVHGPSPTGPAGLHQSAIPQAIVGGTEKPHLARFA